MLRRISRILDTTAGTAIAGLAGVAVLLVLTAPRWLS